MDAAATLIVKQGYLPVSVEALAQAANTSKALVYTYFATQHDLCNALLKREIAGLATAGLETASRVNDVEQSMVLCGVLYFEHVAQRGPLLHILLTDQYMADHIRQESIEVGRTILRRLVRLARKRLALSEKETWAAFEMMATIPEEAGSLAYHNELDLATARKLCHDLMLSSFQALRSPGRVTASSEHVA